MKKLIITLAALVATTGAFAQFNFGVKVGGNLSTISGMVSEDNGLDWGDLASAEASQAMKLGFNAGVYAEYMVMPLLGVQVEANFSMQGVNTTATASSGLLGVSSTTKTAYTANYVNVPVLAKLHFANLRVFAGPQIGFATGLKSTATTTGNDDSKENINKNTFESGDYSGVDFSLVLGGQYKINRNIGVDARYNFGLGNLFPTLKNDEGEVTREGFGKQGVLQLGVFYEF